MGGGGGGGEVVVLSICYDTYLLIMLFIIFWVVLILNFLIDDVLSINLASCRFSQFDIYCNSNDRPYLALLDVYDDSKIVVTSHHEPDTSKTYLNSWTILGSRRERNKENNALPSKWTSHKV